MNGSNQCQDRPAGNRRRTPQSVVSAVHWTGKFAASATLLPTPRNAGQVSPGSAGSRASASRKLDSGISVAGEQSRTGWEFNKNPLYRSGANRKVKSCSRETMTILLRRKYPCPPGHSPPAAQRPGNSRRDRVAGDLGAARVGGMECVMANSTKTHRSAAVAADNAGHAQQPGDRVAVLSVWEYNDLLMRPTQ